MPLSTYVVVTPARNEADHFAATIASMVAQSRRPQCWVIVDDGSSDATPRLIDDAARVHPWIRAVHLADRGHRQQGGGVINAFYRGLEAITDVPWDFLVKFDADLSFSPFYFERCLTRFATDCRLGIGGGVISHVTAGALVVESPGDPAFHVRGATKIYRRECWLQIGGLMRAPGWDTVDELKANMLGWKTLTFADIPLRHHRYTGTADGTWHTQVKFGLANYITGYHPLFMMLKCLKRAAQRPYLIGSLGLFWGFCAGYLRRVRPVDDPSLIRYVRHQQLNKLLHRPSLW